MVAKGEFYNSIISKRKDSENLREAMEQTVQKLLDNDTNVDRPGMLLGKIQGGKTRAFIGITALAFDNGYDMTIILTKGTKALARQTYQRINNDFSEFIDLDQVQLFDILHFPENLSKWVLKQKLIMIVKKETNNLDRTIRALVTIYPDLSKKKVLIIDDEADYASIGFRANKREGTVELRKIASQIDELRKKVLRSDFLQVTATPYSLYLQPDELAIPKGLETFVFKPSRPAFTVLLADYPTYVGGEFYFNESKIEDSMAYWVYEDIPGDELTALEKEDRRSFKVEDSLTHPRIAVLRKGILNFIVGSCIRRIQQKQSAQREQKYSFVVHTEHGKHAHTWQQHVVTRIKDLLVYNASHNKALLSDLVREACSDLSRSMKFVSQMPSFVDVINAVVEALQDDYLMVTKVNSEQEVEQLLDAYGELKLTAPLNIFIGGQILDRGVTIKNLIGFYYGRRPSQFQQDTVLQHSRMFGNRPQEDLAVTRFYTACNLYATMERINEFDSALREAFEKEAQSGVVFICKDPSNVIVPCNPNKILLSKTTTIRPYKRMLPVGFQTLNKTNMEAILRKLDRTIMEAVPADDRIKPFMMALATAESIIDMIDQTLVIEPSGKWEVDAFKASMEYLSKNTESVKNRGKVWCLVRTDRNTSRFKKDGSFSDVPETSKEEGDLAKQIAIDIPVLMLFRQNGSKSAHWMDTPFWWPVLVAPQKTRTVIFTSELVDME